MTIGDAELVRVFAATVTSLDVDREKATALHTELLRRLARRSGIPCRLEFETDDESFYCAEVVLPALPPVGATIFGFFEVSVVRFWPEVGHQGTQIALVLVARNGFPDPDEMRDLGFLPVED